jgi:hypothetical protein
VAPGLIADFPALRTQGTHPTNLPSRLPQLIGRQEDLASLTDLLGSPETAVVTVVGPGGTGKTSLAATLGAEVLSTFPDGVFFVDLSPLTDSSLFTPAIAQALSLRETPGRSLTQSLAEHLSSKAMLLILDNFEQVIDAAPEVSSLLTEAASLEVMVTSREALRIQGERVFSLPPLQIPSQDQSDLEEVARSPAVPLFVERAHAIKADFSLTHDNASDVAAICRRLDGLPLALELEGHLDVALGTEFVSGRPFVDLEIVCSPLTRTAAVDRIVEEALPTNFADRGADEREKVPGQQKRWRTRMLPSTAQRNRLLRAAWRLVRGRSPSLRGRPSPLPSGLTAILAALQLLCTAPGRAPLCILLNGE